MTQANLPALLLVSNFPSLYKHPEARIIINNFTGPPSSLLRFKGKGKGKGKLAG